MFRPGTKFGEFYFTETCDTNATSVENATAGGWGGLFKLEQSSPSASTGKISVFQWHAGHVWSLAGRVPTHGVGVRPSRG